MTINLGGHEVSIFDSGEHLVYGTQIRLTIDGRERPYQIMLPDMRINDSLPVSDLLTYPESQVCIWNGQVYDDWWSTKDAVHEPREITVGDLLQNLRSRSWRRYSTIVTHGQEHQERDDLVAFYSGSYAMAFRNNIICCDTPSRGTYIECGEDLMEFCRAYNQQSWRADGARSSGLFVAPLKVADREQMIGLRASEAYQIFARVSSQLQGDGQP